METVETVFLLEQGNDIPGAIVAKIESSDPFEEFEFEILGYKCKVVKREVDFRYYTGYVDVGEKMTKEQIGRVHDTFKNEITYEQGNILGFDMAHAWNVADGNCLDVKLCLDTLEDLVICVEKAKKNKEVVDG